MLYSGNGKIYVMGGIDGATVASKARRGSMTRSSNTWNTPLRPPSSAGCDWLRIAVNSHDLLRHWLNGGDQINDLYLYDIVANTWSSGANCSARLQLPSGTSAWEQEST